MSVFVLHTPTIHSTVLQLGWCRLIADVTGKFHALKLLRHSRYYKFAVPRMVMTKWCCTAYDCVMPFLPW